MNIDSPHEIISEQELRKLSPAKQARYRPVPDAARLLVLQMSPKEREVWLRGQPELTRYDRLRLQRAWDKRDRNRRPSRR